jgi:hypothetical protein
VAVLSSGGVESARAATPGSDISGYWAHINTEGKTFNIPGMTKNVDVQPSQRAGFHPVDYPFQLLKPWAAAIVRKHMAADAAGRPLDGPQQRCLSNGLPRILDQPGLTEILVTPAQVTILQEDFHLITDVYMNQKHPANLKPAWGGHSVGHWEGDTLVVDTVGFNDKGEIDDTGTPRTTAMHLSLRIRVINGGKDLEALMRIDDPNTFVRPWTTATYWRRGKGPIGEYICEENNRDPHFQDISNATGR